MSAQTPWLCALALSLLASCHQDANDGDDAPRPTASAPVVTANGETLPFGSPLSTIDFVGSKATLSHEGRFESFSGTLWFVPGHIEQSRVSVTIQSISLRTPIADLTEHLHTPDFFAAGQFPTMRFESTSVRPGGANGATHTLVGSLTVRGLSHPIEIPVSISVTPEEVTARSRFSLSRRTYNIPPPPPDAGARPSSIRDDVLVRLAIHAPRPHR